MNDPETITKLQVGTKDVRSWRCGEWEVGPGLC
jgi:hypothetical protein